DSRSRARIRFNVEGSADQTRREDRWTRAHGDFAVGRQSDAAHFTRLRHGIDGAVPSRDCQFAVTTIFGNRGAHFEAQPESIHGTYPAHARPQPTGFGQHGRIATLVW